MDTTDLSPQRAIFATEFVMLGDGAKAARSAGYAHPKQQAYKLLKNPAVKAHIDRLRTRSALQTGLTIADWLEDVQEATEEARKAGAWGAAMKGYDLQGRHLGAFANDKSLSGNQDGLYSFLERVMRRQTEDAALANSGQVSNRDAARITPSNTPDAPFRILE